MKVPTVCPQIQVALILNLSLHIHSNSYVLGYTVENLMA